MKCLMRPVLRRETTLTGEFCKCDRGRRFQVCFRHLDRRPPVFTPINLELIEAAPLHSHGSAIFHNLPQSPPKTNGEGDPIPNPEAWI